VVMNNAGQNEFKLYKLDEKKARFFSSFSKNRLHVKTGCYILWKHLMHFYWINKKYV